MEDPSDSDRDRPRGAHSDDAGRHRAETRRLGPDATASGRSFVVQLTADPATDAFCGRVQHLATLDGGNFSSPDAMVAIMRRVLERVRPHEPDEDESSSGTD